MPMFSNPARLLRTKLADSQVLTELLPWAVDSLSPARGQMLVHQLATTAQSKHLSDLVIVVVESATVANSLSPKFAVCGTVIAQISPFVSSDHSDDTAPRTATVLYAGRAPREEHGEPEPCELAESASLLKTALDKELAARGVQFVQWPQDVSDDLETDTDTQANRSTVDEKRDETHSTRLDSWSEALGFKQLATLCYMRSDLRPSSSEILSVQSQNALQLDPVGHQKAEKLRFESLVEQTYIGTLDCPRLSEFQTTAMTLDGYRASPVFSPDLWFEVKATPATTIGCLILARHHEQRAGSLAADSKGENEGSSFAMPWNVFEVVYMGVVPHHRGRGLAGELVRATLELARKAGCESVILAVDTKNYPARAAYEAAGFVPILFEEVWGKRLMGVKIKASKNEST